VAERTIVVKLRAEIADLKSKMAEASKSTEDFGKRTQSAIEKNSAAINTLSNGAGLLGAAMVAAAGVAVKAFADFDESMSAVRAATHETSAAMDDLREAALDAGQRTKYSATEAAGAIEELAKAGVSTADILGGALDGALDLAAAGNMDVAEAAGLAAVALKQFNLGGDKASHVSDLLAAGAGKAMGDVSDLGMALKQAGLVANSTGLSIEETTAGLSAFASAGLIGSDAGTSFKSMLQRLTPQSDEAQQKFDELGISAYDASGNFVGLAKFSGNLQSAMKDLTPEARNSALAVMFGSDAVRAANVLYNEGAAGIEEWTAKVDDSGYAAETAAIRMDNLKGDWEQLTGSVETALIGLGEGANGPLRDLVQKVTELVNAFSEAPGWVQGTLLALVGGGGLVLLGVAGIGKLIVSLSEANKAIKLIQTSSPKAAAAVGKIGKAAAGLGIFATAAVGVDAFMKATDNVKGVEVTTAALDAMKTSMVELDGIFASMANNKGPEQFTTTIEAMDRLISPELMDRVNDFAGEILSFGANEGAYARDDIVKQFGAIGDSLAAMVSSGDAEKAASQFEALSEAWVGQGGNLDDLQALMPAYGEALAGVANESELTADATDTLTGAYEETTVAVDDQVLSLEDLVKAQRDASGLTQSVMEAQAGLEAATDAVSKSLEDNGATLDITTEKGRANQDALFGIRDAGYDLIESMEANGATQVELQGTMQTTRDRFIAAAEQLGLTGDEAVALADDLGLIPAEISTEARLTPDQAREAAGELRASYDNLGMPVTTSVSLEGLGVVQAGIDRFISNNNGRTIHINTVGGTTSVSSGSGNQVARADGGIVYGPGTGTSDSIPARLSNGEYVIKADSVSRYGKSFFDGLNAQRFATGGYVGPSPSGGGGGSSLAGLAIEGSLDLGNGLTGYLRGVVKDELADVGNRMRYAGGS
jgi:TP901 family phage tail tape measure protein